MILRQITIRNVALIEALTVPFDMGFCVLTGETGAGKSILVDAMNLALGERADRELVRSGADRASVEAIFDPGGGADIAALLGELGVEAPDGTITVIREVTTAGRGTVRINGAQQSLAALRRLTAAMVDLHGQHEHQSLLDEDRHMDILDAYAGDAIQEALMRVREKYGEYAAARRELRSFSGDARERAHHVDMLEFQIREITDAKLKPGEEEELRALSEKLSNMEKIQSAIGSARVRLSGGERSRGAVLALHAAAAQMRTIEAYDEAYGQIAERIEEAAYSMEDVAQEIASFSDEDAVDPRRIDAIEQRMDGIRSLKRKYGDSIEAILAYKERAEEELDKLRNGEQWAKKLEGQIASLREALAVACGELSAVRAVAAKRYGSDVLAHLADLGMSGARFLIEVEPPEEGFEEERFTASGYDRVRFLFSANAGEPVRPLARIASGGEMSRVMLALKSVSAGSIGCLIFDEIDTGVSGRMAQAVGEKIARLAQGRQVICITHLPQIACMADAQYIVFKTEKEGRAGTFVEKLDKQGRVREVARLVGGADGEQAAEQHALGMLEAAQRRKAVIAS